MADIEIQADRSAESFNIRTIQITRRELKNLVQMLANSVQVLQSIVQNDDLTTSEQSKSGMLIS
jgi:hypothetical protein